VPSLAPSSSFAAGAAPALAATGAGAAAGHPAGSSAGTQAPFTLLLDSLVTANQAAAVPGSKKESGLRSAFWVAVSTAVPQEPPNPAVERALQADGSDAKESRTAESAPPEICADAAAAAAVANAGTGMTQSGTSLVDSIANIAARGVEAQGQESDSQPAAEAPEVGAGPAAVQTADPRPGASQPGYAAAMQRGAAEAVRQRPQAMPGEPTPSPAQASAAANGLPDGGAIPSTEREDPAAADCTPFRPAMISAVRQQPPAAEFESRPVWCAPTTAATDAPPTAPALPAAGRPGVKAAAKTDRPGRSYRAGSLETADALAKSAATDSATGAGQRPPIQAAPARVTASEPAGGSHCGEEAAPAAASPFVSAQSADRPDDSTPANDGPPMVVAFTARLRPLQVSPEATEGAGAGDAGDSPEADPPEATSVPPAGAASETLRRERKGSDAAAADPTSQPESAVPVRKAEAPASSAPIEPAAVDRPAAIPQPASASTAQPRELAAPPHAAATEPAAVPEVPKASAHDIKLELSGQGDQRVEVRVSERAGDVRVDVRTPDAGLAGDLREDLPALATKLEQTGFRTEAWHPAGAGERQRTAEASPGSPSQDSEHSGRNSGQKQRDEQQQSKPKPQQDQTPTQNVGKDFAWLFSSIQ